MPILWCLDYRALLDLRIYRPEVEKWVKTLHSESERSWLKPRLPVTKGSNKYQTQWLRWGWWGVNLVFCLIIVVIFIGLGRAYRLGWGHFEVIKWGTSHKGMEHFYGRSWPLKTPCKNFNLAIVGLGWIKWGRGIIKFHGIISALYPFWNIC